MSRDLLIHNGDLILERDDIDGEGVTYDLALMDDKTALTKLVRRTIETPITYIGRYVIDREGITKVDLEYGNKIYLELSEPLNLSWLKRSEGHIRKALSFLPQSVKVTSLTLLPDGLFSVKIDIQYQVNGMISSLTSRVDLEDL